MRERVERLELAISEAVKLARLRYSKSSTICKHYGGIADISAVTIAAELGRCPVSTALGN